MLESLKHLRRTRLEAQRRIEQTVLNKRESIANIRERIGEHQGSPQIVDRLLNDCTDNGTLAKKCELGRPCSENQISVNWPRRESPEYNNFIWDYSCPCK